MSKKVLIVYSNIQSLLRLCKVFPREEITIEQEMLYVSENNLYVDREQYALCVDIVLKARFGRLWIDHDELKIVENFYKDLAFQLKEHLSGTLRKIYLKIFLYVLY